MTGGPAPGGDVSSVLAVVATTAEVLARPELHEGLLAPWERRRLAGIRVPERRDDVVAARLLVRLCAARFTGLPPDGTDLAQLCPGCGRYGHGRPYLRDRPGAGVSLSHADGLVAAAVGPGAVGIDVEPAARRPGPLRVLRRLLPEAELTEASRQADPGPALLRLWVRGEALLKAGQDGLRLHEWTDHRRAAVVAVASAAPTTVFSPWETDPGSEAGGRPGSGPGG
ncbi:MULTISPECIES: 4'-phosphopantetheinyl transferase superfamily protein [unclassified Streptomyces]|uniref:4'-phosphopantetheinyl transferase family protein n=1 Tax=unclassified Streptomyces TaxID=2593676 RepID=UPI0006F3BB3C|nr:MULTISPECIES: 4'-phosphopantetheinyl transferase superfamily protein [unclassified Streptomyces]KQX56288.1 4-phosphopantetheinyl transferase [Streptomyces sp. Root1304]KRA97103.1 4-phosphopantetheinyl transferase [Streptomyces sp. Root66D1]